MAAASNLPSVADSLTSLHAREPYDLALLQQIQSSDAIKPLKLDDNQLKEVMGKLELSFKEGLHPDTAGGAAVKMLPTYIRQCSVGEERGKFLALDFGGSKLRVLMVTLEEGKQHLDHTTYQLSDEIQKGSGTKLFDHLADCLLKFMEKHQLRGLDHMLPLGFTFSFPCRQDGLTAATLVSWTKGFKASGVEGQDVVRLLRDALARRGLHNIELVAVLNDTTGTMLACSFKERDCCVGLIIGTGTNACYMERLCAIPKLQSLIKTEDDVSAEMCINCEWGSFGDDGKLDNILTKFDRILDERRGANSGKQRFEKAISGMYLGELVTLVLEELSREKLFRQGSKVIEAWKGFYTELICDIEGIVLNSRQDAPPLLSTIAERLRQKTGISDVTPTDCAIVAYVCSVISTRAAHLCAAGVAALLQRMDRPYSVVGVDGTPYRLHPTLNRLLSAKIGDLLEPRHKFKLVLSEDGSGRGAAVAAAIAHRMQTRGAAKKPANAP